MAVAVSAVTLRRFLCVCVTALSAAGVLLIIGEQPAHPGGANSDNHKHATRAVNARYTVTGTGDAKTISYQFPGMTEPQIVSSSFKVHKTWWECPAGKTCRKNGEVLFAADATGNRLHDKLCSDHDCAHSAEGLFGAGYTDHWTYAGHEDIYRTKWEGCPSDNGWKNPR